MGGERDLGRLICDINSIEILLDGSWKENVGVKRVITRIMLIKLVLEEEVIKYWEEVIWFYSAHAPQVGVRTEHFGSTWLMSTENFCREIIPQMNMLVKDSNGFEKVREDHGYRAKGGMRGVRI